MSVGHDVETRLAEAHLAVLRGDLSREDFEEMRRAFRAIACREALGLSPLDLTYSDGLAS